MLIQNLCMESRLRTKTIRRKIMDMVQGRRRRAQTTAWTAKFMSRSISQLLLRWRMQADKLRRLERERMQRTAWTKQFVSRTLWKCRHRLVVRKPRFIVPLTPPSEQYFNARAQGSTSVASIVRVCSYVYSAAGMPSWIKPIRASKGFQRLIGVEIAANELELLFCSFALFIVFANRLWLRREDPGAVPMDLRICFKNCRPRSMLS